MKYHQNFQSHQLMQRLESAKQYSFFPLSQVPVRPHTVYFLNMKAISQRLEQW